MKQDEVFAGPGHFDNKTLVLEFPVLPQGNHLLSLHNYGPSGQFSCPDNIIHIALQSSVTAAR